ncbi:hypothetical protein ACLOJK_019250 [Asimina triloba]
MKGSKQAYDYSSKFGPEMVSGPVCFVLEKVFIIISEAEREAAAKAEAAIKVEKENEKEEVKEIVEESRVEIVEESREEIVEESTKVEVEKQEMGDEIQPEISEIVMEPPIIGREAAPPAAAPKA